VVPNAEGITKGEYHMRTAQKPRPINRSGDYTNMLRWRQQVPPANSPEPKDIKCLENLRNDLEAGSVG
jgi:hypothetical protein